MKLKKLLAGVTAAALAVTTMAVTSFTVSAETENITVSFNEYGCVNVAASDVNKYSSFEVTVAPFAAGQGDDECGHKVVAEGEEPSDGEHPFGTTTCDWWGVKLTGKISEDPWSIDGDITKQKTTGNTVEYTDSEIASWKENEKFTGVDFSSWGCTITSIVGTLKDNSSETEGEIEISVSPKTKSIAVDEEFDVTVEVTATEGFVGVEGTLTPEYDETVISVTYKEDGVFTVKGLAAGSTDLTIGWEPDEDSGVTLDNPIADVCKVTVTEEGGDTPATDTSSWTIAASGFTSSWGGWQSASGTAGKLDFTCKISDIMAANEITDISEFGGFGLQVWEANIGDVISYAIVVESADGTTKKLEDSGTVTIEKKGGEGADKDDPNLQLKQYATAACYGEYDFAPTDVVKIVVASGTTVPTIPSDDDPTPPVTGDALWEGNTNMGTDWSANVQIAANKFADIKAGDTLKFTFTCEDGSQLKIMSLAENWPVLPGPNPDPEWGIINVSGTSFSFELTAADVTALKENGMVISGQNVTITKVELVPKAEPKPPVDPDHTHTPATVWSSDAAGHWHACSGCDEKLNFAAHTSDSGTITTPATETTTGTRTYKCTVCGYVIRTETIPATGTSTTPSPWIPYPGVAAPVIPTTGVNNSKLPTVNGKDGWEAVSAEITVASDGDKIVVDMNTATKVPSTILGDIEGKDVDVVFNMGRGITWTINGLSVTNRKTIDLDITKNTRHIPDEVVDNAEGSHKRQISLDHKGTFGCTATLSYDVGTRYNGLYANLFYYNTKTKQLEFADCSLVSGGKAKFVFTHASDYLITISDEPLGEFEDVSSASGIVSDDGVIGNGVAVSAVLAVIVLGFGIVVYRKRRHN
ncbi:MAG: hypothetical protein K2J73_11245 [Oscillospiraceae bacterium]|nr:hypothetical protein [Oscillospiraceae bacterium]